MSYLVKLYESWRQAEATLKCGISAKWSEATIEDWKREAQYRRLLLEEEERRLLEPDAKLRS